MRKICLITGSRAEWGLLSPLAARIRDCGDLKLQLVVTNMHLSPAFGMTCREIVAEGFPIAAKVPILDENAMDSPAETARCLGRLFPGLADVFSRLAPDLVVLLGDRYEILGAAVCALLFNLPIAHIHGGEITEGAYDDAIRHAVTKMSHLHFTSTEEYRRRIIQMGEDPSRVFYVGAMGVENARNVPLLTREELEQSLSFHLGERSLLVTFHPVTREAHSAVGQCRALLQVLDARPDYRIIFTLPNSDAEGRQIAVLLQEYVDARPDRCALFASLGKKRYLSVLNYVSAVVGNSSSGLIEVPSFGIPTLDIGDRQKGRLAAASVFHCEATAESIDAGLRKILDPEFRIACRSVVNPYDKPGTSAAILQVLRSIPLTGLGKKHFFDWELANIDGI